MSLAIRLMPEPVRSINFADIDDIYKTLGTAMTRPIRIIFLNNLTNANMMFSFNGINDHLPLPSWGYLLLDITSNKTLPQGFFLAEGQQIYVRKESALEIPTIGNVYLSTFYGAEL